MSPPLPGQHANLSGCQEEAGFCSKEGNSTPLAELRVQATLVCWQLRSSALGMGMF